MPFGQLIIGAPGAGKTTYCKVVADYLRFIGRPVLLVNLDFANDVLPYSADIDIRDLVDLSVVMEETGLGPNGAFVYGCEYLARNVDWLISALRAKGVQLHRRHRPQDSSATSIIETPDASDCHLELTRAEEEALDADVAILDELPSVDPITALEEELRQPYLLFDCPGQSELYVHSTAMVSIVTALTTRGLSLAQVGLLDAVHCYDPNSFLSLCMAALASAFNFELPCVHFLSKAGNFDVLGQTPVPLNYYTDMDSSCWAFEAASSTLPEKYQKLGTAVATLLEEHSSLCFTPLEITKQDDVAHALKLVDVSNNFAHHEGALRELRAQAQRNR